MSNRLLALLLSEIGYLSSPSKSGLGRLIVICGSRVGGGPVGRAPLTKKYLSVFADDMKLYNSGPKLFWHQEPVLWKTIFPWTVVWVGGREEYEAQAEI